MYRAHFGLREPPFGLTPDTAFTYACTSHQEALNVLLVAVATGEGFIKITGEVGMGKTLLCRRFLSTFTGEQVAAYLPNPMLDPRGLLLALAEELHVEIERDVDQHHLIKSLNHALLNLAREGKRVIVCVDEAQAIPEETLEALRLVSNLETEKRKLMQIVLFGQPELDVKLAKPSVRQLNQRITFQHKLAGLSRTETEYYLNHRLRIAGYAGERLFNSSAVDALFRATRGVPRLINIVAHKAMLAAYGEGAQFVSSAQVKRAAHDTPAAYRPTTRSWATGVVVFAAAIAVALWYFLA